jgi:nicotinate-nucleotide adenylyltransferase
LISKRVGIYAGTFDPVHEGHLKFAEEALNRCGLNKVFFLVEPRPRRKQGVKALEHREAMVRLAITGHAKFGMIMLEQANFNVEETLPKLQALFEGAQLYMLMGEDVFAHLNGWPHVEDLLTASSFIVGVRSGDEIKMKRYLHVLEKIRGLKFDASFLATEKQDISSSKIRLALKRGHEPKGLLPQIGDYIRQHKLYVSEE